MRRFQALIGSVAILLLLIAGTPTEEVAEPVASTAEPEEAKLDVKVHSFCVTTDYVYDEEIGACVPHAGLSEDERILAKKAVRYLAGYGYDELTVVEFVSQNTATGCDNCLMVGLEQIGNRNIGVNFHDGEITGWGDAKDNVVVPDRKTVSAIKSFVPQDNESALAD